MSAPRSRRRTILHALLEGMCAAARDWDCHLLLGCGLGLRIGAVASAPAWPMLVPEANVVLVGP